MFWTFLDRDGTLNLDKSFVHKVADLEIIPNAILGMESLVSQGSRFAIATGQSGIARGMFSVADLQLFNDELVARLQAEGFLIEGIAFCPHYPKISGDCPCRKPKPGMLYDIEKQVGEKIVWPEAWGIGDKPADAEMLFNVGGRAVLLRSGLHNNPAGKVYWNETDEDVQRLLKTGRVFIAHDVLEAAGVIETQRRKSLD